MELMVNKQAVTINETVYDGTAEQPIECDFMLPDYCPDIVKVLRCDVCAKLASCGAAGDKLTAEGSAAIMLIYLSDEGRLCSYEHKLPFSKTVTLKAPCENPVVTANATTNYANCRAVSPRRLDVRGSVTITANVICPRQEEIVSEATGMSVELRRKMLSFSKAVVGVTRVFSLHEELEIGYGKTPAERILRTSAACSITDYKIIAGKVIIKGEMSLHLLYAGGGEGDETDTLDYTIPLSHIMDVDGIDDDCDCYLTGDVSSVFASIKADADGEMKLLDVSADISFFAKAFRACEAPAVIDMYSTEFEASSKSKQMQIQSVCKTVNDTHTEKTAFDLPEENIQKVCEVWCTAASSGVKADENEAVISGTLKICVLAICENGEAKIFERTAELSHRVSAEECNNPMGESCMWVKACEFSGSGAHIEVRTEIAVTALIYSQQTVNPLCEIAVNAEAPKQGGNDCALTIYYAEKEECVWEIAKRYNTSARLIAEQNGIEGETVAERCMLLIPLKCAR